MTTALSRLSPIATGVVVAGACAVAGFSPEPKFFGSVATAVSILCSLTIAANTMLFTIQSSQFAKLLRGYGQTVRFRRLMGDSVQLGFIALVLALLVVALDDVAPAWVRAIATGSAAASIVALYRITGLYVTIFSEHELALARDERAKRERATEADRIAALARGDERVAPTPVAFERA